MGIPPLIFRMHLQYYKYVYTALLHDTNWFAALFTSVCIYYRAKLKILNPEYPQNKQVVVYPIDIAQEILIAVE